GNNSRGWEGILDSHPRLSYRRNLCNCSAENRIFTKRRVMPEVSQEETQSESQPTELDPNEPTAATAQDSPVEAKPNPWKTAFIVLIGIVFLSGIMIYSTSVKQTDPTTVLQTDANGQPVQPLDPASGVEEDRLASMPADAAIANTNTATQPGQL